MARIRSIHPTLASDEAFMSMSMGAKAAWPLLWTECDDNGVFEWKPIVLKARIFPGENIDFNSILDELLLLNSVRKFEADGKVYGAVRNFRRWQRPQKPKYRFPLPDQVAIFVGPRTLKNDTGTEDVLDDSDTRTGKLQQRKEEGGTKMLLVVVR